MPLCSWKCVDRSKARRQRAGSNRFRPSRSKTARERHDASNLTTRKEYLKTAQTLLRSAKTMTNQAIATQLKVLTDDYERRAEKASLDDGKHLLDPLLALNTSGIHELMNSFPQQLSGQPEIELQSKVDPSVGGERAVSARVSFGVNRRASFRKKGGCSVPRIGIRNARSAGPANQGAG